MRNIITICLVTLAVFLTNPVFANSFDKIGIGANHDLQLTFPQTTEEKDSEEVRGIFIEPNHDLQINISDIVDKRNQVKIIYDSLFNNEVRKSETGMNISPLLWAVFICFAVVFVTFAFFFARKKKYKTSVVFLICSAFMIAFAASSAMALIPQ